MRIRLVRPGTNPEQVAVDTTIDFPPNADSVRVVLTVQLQAGATSEHFDLMLAMLNAAGNVVFRGGPVRVTAVAGPVGGQAPPVPMVYVGVGSNAAGVRFRTPVPATVFFGDTALFVAEAFDSSGQVIAGTPILYKVDPQDTTRAQVPDPAFGRVVAKATRGQARVIAELLTHQTATTMLKVQPHPTAILVTSGNGQTGTVGAALPQQLVAKLIASDSLPVVGVQVQFAMASGGGSVTPTSAVTDTLGQAYASATLGPTSGAQSFTAMVTGLPVATFSATALAGAATRLAFTVQPSNAAAGAPIAPPVQVSAQDSLGNTATLFSGAVSLVLGTNPGGDTLGGTVSKAAVAGVATFSNLTLVKAATGYTLAASASGLTSATSSAFNITAGAATTLVLVSGNNQSGTLGQALPQPIVVKVTDAFDNGVSGRTVTFAVASGGGTVNPPSATTGANGTASFTWTLGTSGTQAVTVTATGLTPLTVTANTSATTVTPHLDSLTALGATFQLAAQTRDAQGNLVSNPTYTWTSRATGVATVNSTGLVTAVANGSTYVVAAEAGGSKDSAMIVVQQQIASINVTPSTRSLYLTGRFAFTAAAVDGRGNAMSGVTSFVWSSTAPAVASVDTSHSSSNVVTAVGLGTTQVRATAGSITGVANVTVLTPITRIAVVFDTAGASKTDTFTMTSLALTRRYRAIAHDTLDNVMTGVSFTWGYLNNGSVAALDSITPTTVRATSAANGVTTVNATAQGFTSSPGALLTVSQVLASIELKPDTTNPTATIAVGGTTHVSARGKDANGRYISGGSFTYRSSAPSIATVDSSNGLVTGVSQGQDTITATSRAITSNPVVVTVSNTGPAIISFGRDTLSVGRGSSTSIPILLSKPAGSSLTVNLAINGGFAHWSSPSVTIPAGQTSANATLVGDSAGTATATATDGSGLGYSSGSAVVRVTANMSLALSSYYINATDMVQTQVLLSDPSPAGGTYVAFAYSTAGIASASPDPAFIPAGQLAADVQIRGVAAGTTYITPQAIGVNGSASYFQAYAPVLTPCTYYYYNYALVLGQGQYDPNNGCVYLPTYTHVAVPVTLTNSDTNVITVPASVTVPASSYYAYWTTTAKAVGTATISLSSPGWTAASSISVVVTTPHVGICCGYQLYTTSPQQSVTVYAEDSTRNSHYRTNSLVVRLRSSDTTVMRVLDTVLTIPAGSYYAYGRVIPAGLGGSAYIIAMASGHTPDSTQYTVLGPPLAFSWTYYGAPNYIGVGQVEYYGYVYVPNSVTTPLVVSIANTDSTVLGVPTSVTIPTGNSYVYFTVRGKKPGSVTLTATATGFQSATGSYIVTSPMLTACCNYTFNNFGAGSNVYVYSADSLGASHYRLSPLSVSIMSTDTTVVRVDSASVTIDSGTTYNYHAHLTPVGAGTARIIFAASGHTSRDTLTITVNTPQLRLSLHYYYYYQRALLGRRQHFDPNNNGFYVYTPDTRTSPLAVTITQKNARVDSLTTTTPTVPANSYYAYLDAFGLAYGTDTLIASATGYLPDTAFITVTTPKLLSSNLPSTTTTTNPPIGMYLYVADSTGSTHYSMDTLVVAATSSDTTVIQPAQRSFRIVKNAYYAQTSVNVVGQGIASMTYSDSAGTGYQPVTTNSVTVTGPSFTICCGTLSSPHMLGMRQTDPGGNSAYVQVPNTLASNLVVNLVSTDPRVATVPATVTIAAGSYYAYFPITAQDTVGTIQIQATATGYNQANMYVRVTQPRFVISTSTSAYTTSSPRTIYVTAADANGNAHATTENVTVTLASSAPSVASIDSSMVTIVSGSYQNYNAKWSPGVVGTSQLSASDTRSALYSYNGGTVNVAVNTPTLSFSWVSRYLGIGQYDDYATVYAPDYQASALTVTLSHIGTARTGTFTNGTNTATTSVTIPQNGYYQYFRLSGVFAGTDSLVASATSPAHNPDTAYTVVGQGRVDPIGNWPSTVKAGDSVLVTLYARDPNQGWHNVVAATTFTLAPNSNIEFRSGGAVVTAVTVPADQYYVQFYVKGVSAGTGSATILATNYQTYTTPAVTVSP